MICMRFGYPFGEQTAVLTARRTDVYPEDDVPELDQKLTTTSRRKTRTFSHTGTKVFRDEGEIWCEE